MRRAAVLILLLMGCVLVGRGAVADGQEPQREIEIPGLRLDPQPVLDLRKDHGGGPLDVQSVTFGQRDTQLRLRIVTASRYYLADLARGTNGAALCLELSYGQPVRPRGRMCVTESRKEPALTFARINEDGAPFRARLLPAFVTRPNRRTIEARFTPAEAEIPYESVRWRVVSRWRNNRGCDGIDRCVDMVPNHTDGELKVQLLAQPPCFGAAARDPVRPCTNPALRKLVVPDVYEALLMPNAPCERIQIRRGLIWPCQFGVEKDQAQRTVALIGDSHAVHWRGALEVVAQARRWRGLTISRSGCPFTRSRPILPTRGRTRQCSSWNAQVRDWVRRHPEVHTIFFSAHARARSRGDRTQGFKKALRELPKTVKRIYVLRDVPGVDYAQADCIQRVAARKQAPGRVCAQLRSRNLRGDPLAAAAKQMGGRVKLIDMTHFMCERKLCLAVVGGVLVRKDATHMTNTFAETLGPYVLASVRRYEGG